MPLSPITPPVIAHRGDSTGAPENTLAALNLAAKSGAKWVEFDVKLTRDGKPILMHDDTLERTTNGKGNVADMDWADMQKLDAGGGERVPLLSEALQCLLDNNLQPMIELKPCPGRARATTMVTMIEAAKLWPEDRPVPLILSFDRDALAIAAQMQPHWPRAMSLAKWRDNWREEATQVGAEALVIDADLFTREQMPALARSGLLILAYTVNDPARAKHLLSEGVNAVFSDDPKKVIAAL